MTRARFPGLATPPQRHERRGCTHQKEGARFWDRRSDPIVAELGPRNVFTGRDLGAAIIFSSPLSLPAVADALPPMLRTALG